MTKRLQATAEKKNIKIAKPAANLRLVAAAPVLLALLERLLDGVLRLPELPLPLCPLDIEQARAAIAKATGGDK